MRLYYHNKIGSIPLFDNIRKLMEASYGSSAIDMKTAADLLAVKSLQDPVRDFVDFYFHEQGVSIGDTDMSYVVNRLYNAKGGLEVFNVMKELLSIPEGTGRTPIDFSITCVYDFPNMDILNFRELKVEDINRFVDKLSKMTYVLLFYDKLKVTIDHLILRVSETLYTYILSGAVPYTETIPEEYIEPNAGQGN